MEGFDKWHGILIGCITTLAAVIAAMWRHSNAREKAHEKLVERLHADHKDDIRELTNATLQLGLSVVARGLLPRGSADSQPPSGETPNSAE
jgi:hypothetical protein